MANGYTLGYNISRSEVRDIEEITGRRIQDLSNEEIRGYLELINCDVSGYDL